MQFFFIAACKTVEPLHQHTTREHKHATPRCCNDLIVMDKQDAQCEDCNEDVIVACETLRTDLIRRYHGRAYGSAC